MTGPDNEEDRDTARGYAVRFNGQVWSLLENPRRTPEEDRLMVHAAHASHLHWLAVGEVANRQRGLWLISRVYAELGNAGEALEWAQECRRVTEGSSAELEDFDLAYCDEALARAHAIGGDFETAGKHRAAALQAAAAVANDKSREYLLSDIAAGNWGGMPTPSSA